MKLNSVLVTSKNLNNCDLSQTNHLESFFSDKFENE